MVTRSENGTARSASQTPEVRKLRDRKVSSRSSRVAGMLWTDQSPADLTATKARLI